MRKFALATAWMVAAAVASAEGFPPPLGEPDPGGLGEDDEVLEIIIDNSEIEPVPPCAPRPGKPPRDDWRAEQGSNNPWQRLAEWLGTERRRRIR
ncbi:MAG: hypothetical protein CME06_01635 [Gemmatimonadetes bacterium]|nr:hypothetical protein [Gemmatimonadota bacterium]